MTMQRVFGFWIIPVLAGLTTGRSGFSQTAARTTMPPVVSANFTAPAHPVDWSHYRYPEECQNTVFRMIDSVAWGVRADTLQYRIHDTLPTIAVETAKRCLTRFPLSAVAPFQVPILFNLALQGNDDTMIRSVVAQQRSLAATVSVDAQGALLLSTIRWLLNARPARISLAYEYAKQADSLGDAALSYRAGIMAALRSINRLTGNLDSLIANTRILIDYWQRQPADQLSSWEQQALPGQIAREQAMEQWYRYLKTGQEEHFAQYAQLMQRSHPIGALIGRPSPALRGDFWFNLAGTQPPSVAAPGRVSLVVFFDHMQSFYMEQFYGYAWLKRIRQRFPEVDIILAGVTHGYFRDIALPMTREQEANYIHSYLTDSLALPGIQSLSNLSHHKYPNGRLLPLPDSNQTNYLINPNTDINKAYVIDAGGRIAYVETLFGSANVASAGNERMLMDALAFLLRKSAGAPTSGSASAPASGSGS